MSSILDQVVQVGVESTYGTAVALATSVENVCNDYPTLSGAVTGLMFIEPTGISMSSSEAGADGPRVFTTVHIRVKGKLA